MKKQIIVSALILSGFIANAELVQDTSKKENDRRRVVFVKKYGSINGGFIAKKEVKVGFTMDMVSDALGTPDDIREEVSGSKTKVTFVYNISSTRADYYYFNGSRILTGWKKQP